MLGAFRQSAPLSGGLLWKIPWRLSTPQKQRQRRRLRKVDNVVTVLSTALQNRLAASTTTTTTTLTSQQTLSNPSTADQTLTSNPQNDPNLSSPSDLHTIPASQLSRRHGKGPKQGDFLPNSAQPRLLSDAARENGSIRLLERWKAEMPREEEMLARDKYTIFDRKARGYRKGIHKVPKWTRVSQRVNPPGF